MVDLTWFGLAMRKGFTSKNAHKVAVDFWRIWGCNGSYDWAPCLERWRNGASYTYRSCQWWRIWGCNGSYDWAYWGSSVTWWRGAYNNSAWSEGCFDFCGKYTWDSSRNDPTSDRNILSLSGIAKVRNRKYEFCSCSSNRGYCKAGYCVDE